MAIAQMPEGTAPRVERLRDQVAIWALDEGDQHGFLLTAAQAVEVAVKMLAVAAEVRGNDLPGFDVRTVAFDSYTSSNAAEAGVRLVFDIGAPLAAFLSLDQFSDLMATGAIVSRELDRGFTPRRDENSR